MEESPFGPLRTEVGFIGLGIMGGPMAGHLLAAGYRVHVHNRSRHKAEPLLARGARWHDTVKEIALASDVVLTIVGFPRDVEEVFLGDEGLVRHARPGTYLVDMTTSDPELARRIDAAGNGRQLRCLDAPVTGGEIGAERAELAIMVGGAAEDFHALAPIFACLGSAVHQGGAGFGQHAKLANQIAIGGTIVGVCEALAYARRAGLEPDRLFESISRGAAKSALLLQLGPRMLQGDFAPGFFVKHFLKDLDLALASSKDLGLDARGLSLVRALYAELAESGHEHEGTQALFRLYEPTSASPHRS